jgi:hypothetical protein
VPAERRSALPNVPGVPWWGAVLIAVLTTAAGFAFDAGSGSTELTNVFAGMYVIGCLVAVLAVRQAGIFTAVVQPPLILFVAVPGAYYLFHHAEIQGAKDILINCGYPLIERFLLMFSTSLVVLLIGMARWYFGAAGRAGKATATTRQAASAGAFVQQVRAKLSTLWAGRAASADTATETAEPTPPKHGIDRPATAAKPPRTKRPVKRTAPTRSRHARPPAEQVDAPPPEPRRRRPSQARDFDRDYERGAREYDRGRRDEPPAPPRRRPRVPRDPDQRTTPPRQPRPRDEADPYGRPAPRRNRYEPHDPLDRREPPPDRYDAPPPRRRPTANGTGPSGTHHPVSRVRYRGTDAEDGDNHVEYRRPPRSRHGADADRWPREP